MPDQGPCASISNTPDTASNDGVQVITIRLIAVEAFEIQPKGLDPVRIILQDLSGGAGRLIIECYGKAWSGYWGATGSDTLRGFLLRCDADYIANRIARVEDRKPFAAKYLLRIVEAVLESLKFIE